MRPTKNIFYISSLCSPSLFEFVFETSTIKPLQAVHKFYRLLAEGFATHEKSCHIETLSVVPVIAAIHKKRFWNLSSEVVGNLRYNYVPMINLPVIKNITVFIYSFFKVVYWNLLGGRKDKVVICEALNLSVTAGALFACKLTGTKAVAIVTDLPNLMVSISQNQVSLKHSIYNKVVSYLLLNFNGYILLTEQMNEVVNRSHKPYIIMEGLVDTKMVTTTNLLENKASERVLIYAGGIYEIYGIKKLIEAFMQLEGDDLRLHIYGWGEMEKDMPYYMALDKRIIYKGTVSNQKVVDRQLEATLLINPRPSDEEFTKYSFPSKNMEYMVSGTPLVTTPLPGMPKEYTQFVYLFNDESIEGIYKTLKFLLSKPKEELHNFGRKAKEFVLTNKSNYIQAARVIMLLEEI